MLELARKEKKLIHDPTFDVHWYCPYCGKKENLTHLQWQERLRITRDMMDDFFPYCNKRHKFLMALKGREQLRWSE